jgi:hypothetical protein
VTPKQYEKFINGASPLPKLGWKLSPDQQSEDKNTEIYIRQLSEKWVKSSFQKMAEEGRDEATIDTGLDMLDVEFKNISRILNVFGARPVYPPAGEYDFKLQVSESSGKTAEIKEPLTIDWHPDWLIKGKPYRKKEFWNIVKEDNSYIYAVREKE